MPSIEVIDKIRSLRLRGESCGAIAKKVGLSRQRVQVLVNKHQLPFPFKEKTEPMTATITVRMHSHVREVLDQIGEEEDLQTFLRNAIDVAIENREKFKSDRA